MFVPHRAAHLLVVTVVTVGYHAVTMETRKANNTTRVVSREVCFYEFLLCIPSVLKGLISSEFVKIGVYV